MTEMLNGLRELRDSLDERIAALVEERKPIREQMGNLDRTYAKLQAQQAEVKQKIAALSIAPSVSDHAVTRYLERRYGFSFENIRNEMLTPIVVEAMKAGCERVKALDGTMVIKGMKVVTYAP